MGERVDALPDMTKVGEAAWAQPTSEPKPTQPNPLPTLVVSGSPANSGMTYDPEQSPDFDPVDHLNRRL